MPVYEVVLSPTVARFQDRIMDGREYLSFELLCARLRREPGGVGRKELSHRGERRALHFSYYVSARLRSVFILTVYQERPGEPRDDDLREEKNLLEAIRLEENR